MTAAHPQKPPVIALYLYCVNYGISIVMAPPSKTYPGVALANFRVSP